MRATANNARSGGTCPATSAAAATDAVGAVAAVDLHLTDDEVAALQDPYVPHPVAGRM